jgi:hypothetical protein
MIADSRPPRYLILANPNGKRCEAYLHDLHAFWQARGVTPEIDVISWRKLIPGNGNLDGFSAFDRPALVRIESPGKDFDVARLLLQAGAGAAGKSDFDWLSIPYEKGKQLRPQLLYRGFCQVLDGLRKSLSVGPWLKPTACPAAIAELFDKNATCRRLAAAEIPVPESIAPPATPAELLRELQERQWRTAYVKLNTGSSASCMAVVHPLDEPAWAWSTLLRLNGGFYSTRRLCRYEAGDLHAVLEFLLAEGACVQRGIPMAQIDGQNFDVRVVMIHGRPAFHIFRLSSQPMTNLQFGGRRGDVERCRAAIPTRAWLDAVDHCTEAARFYDCDMVGIDLLFERGYSRHFILEINAFGDFFPGLRDAQGRTVHEVEIEETGKRMGWL